MESASSPFLAVSRRSANRSSRPQTPYDAAKSLLIERGWAQGTETAKRGALSLTGAIEIAFCRAEQGEALARVARCRRNLRALAGSSNLLAWNDDVERTFADVVSLLDRAAALFADDDRSS